MIIGHYMQGIWNPGGIATYIRRISKAQRDAGHTVHYLDTHPFTGVQSEAVDLPIVVSDDNDLFVQAKSRELDILHLHTTVGVLPQNCPAVIRTVHGNNPYCPSGSRYLKRWNQPCDRAYSLGGCLWGHFIDHCGSIRPQRFYPGFQSVIQDMNTLKKATVIANSQFVKDQMLRSGYQKDGVQIQLLHYPAPQMKEYVPPEQDGLPHFVFLGRINVEKGLTWLLKAIAEIKVPIHMDIAGSGPQEQEIHRQAEQLGLMNRVTFHGWVNEVKAMQLLQNARALVFPSIWHEPAGIVSLEAAAAGRPIIASKVGGIPEYVERLQNALLVEPNDVHGLARSIEHLAMDWSLAQRMGAKGRRMAEEYFSLEEHMQKLMRLYESSV